MYIEQLYTNCLAHAAYYIESEGEAAVIDPLRDYAQYTSLAEKRGARIKYVLETHFHADFVSGHIDLAEKTGATIVFGKSAQPGYKAHIADDGEVLKVGSLHIEVLHTPGHTLESACYLLYDESGKQHALFTGDTLFVNDTGRPDLLSGNMSKETLAGMLFDSLHNKVMTLPPDVIVYPGHGPGSACGKNIGKETESTIGAQKVSNPALTIADKAEFVAFVTKDLPVVPGYFFKDATINRGGYRAYDEIIKEGLKSLSVAAFAGKMGRNTVILDTRSPEEFAKGFVRGSLNIGLEGDFAVWAGTMINPDALVLLVTEAGKEEEAVRRLARIGYEHVGGYLAGGIDTWAENRMPMDRIETFDGHECAALLETESYDVLDVRNRPEVAKNRFAGSVHVPLNELKNKMHLLHPDRKWLIYCAAGYRSMIAASFLRANGFDYVATVEGGMKEILYKVPELVELSNDTE